MTKQRSTIYHTIVSSEEHLTAEEIFTIVKKQLPSISLGTVYRNLGILAEQGEIRKITTALNKDVFDKTTKPHGHILCPICGRVKDYESAKLNRFFYEEFGDSLTSYNLTLNMVCDECKKN